MIKGKALYEKCLKISTPEKQYIKFIEESSELNQAISKYIINPTNNHMDNIIEELIDVELMVKQLKYMIRKTNGVLYTIKKKEKLEKANKKINE